MIAFGCEHCSPSPGLFLQTGMDVNRMWPQGQPGASQTHLRHMIRQNSEDEEGLNPILSWGLAPSRSFSDPVAVPHDEED